MKLRRLPEDFDVREQNSLPIRQTGAYAVYELRKTGWTTLDALDRLARIFNLPRSNMAHAGLKDRHAVTSQLVTVRGGPRHSCDDNSMSLTYLGQSERAVTSDDIAANHFRIVLRSLRPDEHRLAEAAIPEIQKSGVPNYFDDQRFGSWFPEHGFIATAWIREQYEQALRLTFAEPEPLDDAEEREQKAILRENWGNWLECKRLLSRSHRRSVITYLCDHPTNFKGAWGLVNGDLRGLYLSALQSDLWNKIVSREIQELSDPGQTTLLGLRTGSLHCPRAISEDNLRKLSQMQVPLPSGRVRLDEFPNPERAEEILREQGWELRDLKVKFPRDRFFSRARRPVFIPVRDFSAAFSEDELDAGQGKKLTLRFALPRGAYATMVVKRLFIGAETAAPLEEAEQE